MNEQPENQRLVFVIHKHQATTMHYDFRLEIGGVMPSWAIPKGPTLDPQLKRLAMPTTDHALDYRHFEGVLEEGQEGAGPVMVWDEGTYSPQREIGKGVLEEVNDRAEAEALMQQGQAAGQLKFRLDGHKLQGSFALVRTRGFGKKESWLLIKHRDGSTQTGYDANDYDFSAISGRSLAEIAAEPPAAL
jgi:bifunctional non-homologous end joining protein LigD